MPAHARPSSRDESSRRRWLAIGLGAAFTACVVLGFIALRAAAHSYLRSGSFRQFVAAQAGAMLHAEVTAAPFEVTGLSFFSGRFDARGDERASFAALELEQVRAELSLRRLLARVWQIERVEIQRAQLALEGPRIELPAPSASSSSRRTPPRGSWLPNRVEIGSATVRDFDLRWKEGALSHTALEFTPAGDDWKIAGGGGELAHAQLPKLEVQALALRYRAPSLFIERAELRQPPGGAASALPGAVAITGEVRFGESLDLRAKLDGIALSPLLAEDWRVRLAGDVAGELEIHSPLPPRDATRISGTLHLSRGELKALPVLDEIAVFTRTAQFRRLALSRGTAQFVQEDGHLRVTSFTLESAGLIRVEGSFTVEQGMIDGAFQIGVTPASLQWLPGSQARVFTEPRDGYVWAPLRLHGPLSDPIEDLTPRLIAAAQGAVIEGAGNAVRDTLQTGKKALQGALDLLLPR